MQQQNNNPYNQPPQGPMIPPQGAPRPRGWRERWLQWFCMSGRISSAKELTLPNWLTRKAIVFFFVAMYACWGKLGLLPENQEQEENEIKKV